MSAISSEVALFFILENGSEYLKEQEYKRKPRQSMNVFGEQNNGW